MEFEMKHFATFIMALAAASPLSVGAATPAHAASEYRVQAGDVVEVSVATMPEMRQRVAVQLDGSISIPLAGTIVIEGATISELRSRVRSALASKLIRVRTADGRDVSRTVESEEVAVGVVEYKPIFVTGDILRSGEQAFRPRMTARHAIISAGGSLASGRAAGQAGDMPAVRTEYVNAWLGAAAEEARIWRIRNELGDKVKFDLASLPPSPVAPGVVPELLALEHAVAERHDEMANREKEFFRLAIKESDQQITMLTEQQKTEEESVQADTHDLQRAVEMYGKGNLPSPRVTDYRRAVLMSSTRKLQTGAQLIQVRRAKAEFARSLEKVDDERRLRLITERRDAFVKSAVERAKLQSAEDKFRQAGLQAPRAGDTSDKVEIVILRRTEQGRNRLFVDQDAELQPGDVVEVSMNPQSLESVRLAAPAPGTATGPQSR